jgi:hypothetical protein
VRFAQVQKLAVYILAALGLVALGAGGELPVSSVGLTAGLCASWFAEGDAPHERALHPRLDHRPRPRPSRPRWRAVFLGADPLVALVELAALLQVNRLASRRTARDYQQITLLSILMLIAATVLGGGLSYAAAFVGFVIVAPWALTLGHLRREIEGNYLADARAGRAGRAHRRGAHSPLAARGGRGAARGLVAAGGAHLPAHGGHLRAVSAHWPRAS